MSPIDDSTVLALARTLQFGDTALPIGSFSFSAGLETAVAQGVVTDARTLEEFVRTVRSQGAVGDAIAVLVAHRCAAADDLVGVVEADRSVVERKLNDEAREATQRMGRKLAEVTAPLVATPLGTTWLEAVQQRSTPGTYPATLGLMFAAMGIDERHAFVAHQYGITATVLGAALRLLRVDHHQTQSIAYRVNAEAGAEYHRASDATLADMSAFAPVTDVLAALHVDAHVRMFMS